MKSFFFQEKYTTKSDHMTQTISNNNKQEKKEKENENEKISACVCYFENKHYSERKQTIYNKQIENKAMFNFFKDFYYYSSMSPWNSKSNGLRKI